MPRLTVAAIATLGLLSLACGGLSNEHVSALDQVCAEGPAVVVNTPLPSFEGPSPGTGLTLVLGADWHLGDLPLDPTREALVAALPESVERAEALARLTGKPFVPELLVAAPPDTSGTTLAMIASAAFEAKVPRLIVLGTSSKEQPAPEWVDPVYAADVLARTTGVDPSMHAMTLAQEFETQLALCPEGTKAFGAVASASPEARCALMVYGMKEALPTCPLTDGAKVVTLLQLVNMPAEHALSMMAVDLDPSAAPTVLAPDATLQGLIDGGLTDGRTWWTTDAPAGE